MSVISLVFGIIALICSVFGGGTIGIICGVLGIIFGAISAVQKRKSWTYFEHNSSSVENHYYACLFCLHWCWLRCGGCGSVLTCGAKSDCKGAGLCTIFQFTFPFIDLKITKIPLYGLCIAFGILVASLIAYFVTKKKGIAFAYFIIVETCCYAVGFLGAKILFVVVSFPRSEWLSIFASFLSLQNKSNALMTTGFVFYGGLIFGVAGYFVGCKTASR